MIPVLNNIMPALAPSARLLLASRSKTRSLPELFSSPRSVPAASARRAISLGAFSATAEASAAPNGSAAQGRVYPKEFGRGGEHLRRDASFYVFSHKEMDRRIENLRCADAHTAAALPFLTSFV